MCMSKQTDRRDFTSVGADCQEVMFAMARAWSCSLVAMDVALCQGGGMVGAVRRRWGVATRRVDSSLRSHRACQSHCWYACSGLNKTLFASTGPNSRLRGHQASTGSLMTNESLCKEQDSSCLGRMKPTRGHRCDGASLRQSMPELLNATAIPPYVIVSSSDFSFLNTSFLCFFGLVGGVEMVGRFGSLVEGAVAHHGVEGSQESSGHGDIGFGVSDAADESLPDFLLSGVMLTQGDGGFAEGPAEGGRAGLGDGSGLGSAGGFFEVGGEAGPEFQGVGIGEAIEGADFGGNDATPDIADAGDALEDGHLSRDIVCG